MATAPAPGAPAAEPPPSLPSPDLELPPAPDEPSFALYSKRLDFRGGSPRIAIRLMEGHQEVAFSPLGPMRVRVMGPVEKQVEAPAQSSWRVRVVEGEPAQLRAWIQLDELRWDDKARLEEQEQLWRERGIATRREVLGSVYGIAGKVIDNRRHLLLIDQPFTPAQAPARQEELLRRFGARTSVFEEVEKQPRGILQLLDAEGHAVALGQDQLIAESPGGFAVSRVEHGVGYDTHGFEDRSYRGDLQLAVDHSGKLAVINLVSLEELIKGIVPSEIFPKAPLEALKAQAVTARGEVLAKIGLRHLADPYLICSEQHCAVYKGRSGEAESTNAAVDQTRGEALFSAKGRLVDSVYSAVCGGHTEDNDAVWGGPADPNLRGKPDLLPAGRAVRRGGTGASVTPKQLAAFLAAPLPAACRLSRFASPTKFRWEKRISAERMAALTAGLKIGAVRAIAVTERGVSGRARALTLSGEEGATQIRGELNIRRLFGMLSSAMFLVSPEPGPDGKPAAWLFRGGGWGHGVGMCQQGAIGRAEAGQDYRVILRHYFNGARVARLY